MTEINDFKCVNCGEPSAALYKSYGPTVLKLTKCVSKLFCKAKTSLFFNEILYLLELN